jgi:anthranilate synthase/aminodeoxychorismate synthase-like glutamine amidotransferase
MLLLIDNYDSFVHNLARYFNELGCETRVVRNDEVDVSDVVQLGPQAVVISPGPCTPDEAGISVDIVKQCSGTVPILGVCLGHQAIGAAFGADIIRAKEPVHGRTSLVHHDDTSVFVGLPNPFQAARYHSLIVDEQTLSTKLSVVARAADGTPMAIAHQDDVTIGVQFHPESILTDHGHQLLKSFLRLAGINTPNVVPQLEYQPDSPGEFDWPVVPF